MIGFDYPGSLNQQTNEMFDGLAEIIQYEWNEFMQGFKLSLDYILDFDILQSCGYVSESSSDSECTHYLNSK